MSAASGLKPRIVTAHQPVYLPWLGLFHKIALSDLFVYFDDVQYQRYDWNARNKIKTLKGPLWLSVPVVSKEHFKVKLKDVLIQDNLPWPRKHFMSISHAYGKAPYAKRYLPFFDELYKKPWERLSDLNETMLRFFLKELDIRVEFTKLSDLKLQSAKSDLVLETCQKVSAGLFIFGVLGKDYADQTAFERAGIRVEFQDYVHPAYDQLHGDFVSHLSVLDLLMNHGPASLDILMSGNITRDQLIAKHFGALR